MNTFTANMEIQVSDDREADASKTSFPDKLIYEQPRGLEKRGVASFHSFFKESGAWCNNLG